MHTFTHMHVYAYIQTDMHMKIMIKITFNCYFIIGDHQVQYDTEQCCNKDEYIFDMSHGIFVINFGQNEFPYAGTDISNRLLASMYYFERNKDDNRAILRGVNGNIYSQVLNVHMFH